MTPDTPPQATAPPAPVLVRPRPPLAFDPPASATWEPEPEPGRSARLRGWVTAATGPAVAVLVIAGGIAVAQLVGSPRPPAAASSTSSAPAPAPAAAAPSPTAAAPAPAVTPPTPAGSPAASAAVAARAPVVVLNASHVTGLAGRTATRLRAAGWTVLRIGNLSAAVSRNTVYYDPGARVAAAALVAAGLGAQQALPRPAWLADSASLVLVLAGT